MTLLLLVVGLSLTVSFFCSVLEAVLLSLSHSFVHMLEERGDRAGVILNRLRKRIDEPIAAILTLNTIAHTVGAAMSGALALEVFGQRWIALFSAVLTLAILLLSEIIPKTLGATYWQQLARPVAYVLSALTLVMKPIIVPLGVFNRLIAPRGERPPTVSRAELEVLAEIGRREGQIDEEEWQVVDNILHLGQIRIGEVMTPRTSMVAVSVQATVEEAQSAMLNEGHLRIPVYEDSIDNVVGILLARDLWRAMREGVEDIRAVMRPPRFVPTSKLVEDLIREMRRERIKMSIVVDEFGGTAGLVTLEDLIEEIVGEIQDEHEMEPLAFEMAEGGEVRIDGSVPLWEVNERFELRLPEDLYDTLGGYIFGRLGRIAHPGDEVKIPEGRFRVLSMDGRRIERIMYIPLTDAIATAAAD